MKPGLRRRLLLLAAAAALVPASFGAVSCALVPFYVEPLPPEAEKVEAKTADGWRITLVRYKPREGSRGPPVLLSHGIAANGRNMDVDSEHSMARWFAAHGRESFTISLRGTGDSDHPSPKDGRPYNYSIDTFAQQDFPAAIAKIQELTGAKSIDFVGHSMGGLIGYIYLARGGRDMRRVVTLGSPARFPWGGLVERTLQEMGTVAKNIDRVDTPTLAHTIMPLHGRIAGPVDWMLYNPDNVSPPVWRKLIAVGLGTISGGVLRQFGLWIEKDRMVSADGAIDYFEQLAKVRTPVFVIGGKLDRVAPVPGTRAVLEALGGPTRFFLAGEENGLAHDYGHMDLVMGDSAPKEVWPRVLQFLDEP